MKEFFLAQMDYVFFLYGLAFVILGVMIFSGLLRRKDLPWSFLGWFGMLHGVNEWLDMLALDIMDNFGFKVVRLAVMAVSFLALFEFGRRSAKTLGVLISPLVYVPVVFGITALGLSFSLPGFNAGTRYLSGFCGALLSGIVCCVSALRNAERRDIPLLLIGASLCAYAVFSGLIVPKSGFFPAAIINQEAFFTLGGIPVQVFRLLCALMAAFGVWFASRKAQGKGWKALKEEWLLPLAVLFVLVLGVLLVNWRASSSEGQMRAGLLNAVIRLTKTINSGQVDRLTFTSADKENTQFQRLQDKFIELRSVSGFHSIYTMALRGGKIVFGPESIPEGDARASPPGLVYQEPRREVWDAFKKKRPYTLGPVQDKYGTFVSAFAPILNPRSGEVMMLVAIEVESGEWNQVIFRERISAIGIVFFFLVLIILGYVAFHRRRAGVVEKSWRKHYESWVVAVLGIALTGLIVMTGYIQELNGRQMVLQWSANNQSEVLLGCFHDIREHYLQRLIQIFTLSQDVSRAKFKEGFGDSILMGWIAGYGWAPLVRASERAAFEENLRAEFGNDASIFYKDSAGNKLVREPREEYYPLYYVEPYEEIKSAIGFDVTSNPPRWAAVQAAMKNGLPTATDTVNRVSNGERVINVYASISNRGAVYVAVRLQELMKVLDSQSTGELPSRLVFFQSQKEQPPLWLASLDDKKTVFDPDKSSFWRTGVFNEFYPLMFFGKLYFFSVQYDDSVFVADKRVQALSMFLAGVLMSLIGAYFTGFMLNRQSDLEDEVSLRVLQLKESEESYRRQFVDNGAPMFLVDPVSGGFLQVNKAALAFYGYSQEKMLTMKIGEVNILGKVALGKVVAVVKNQGASKFEFRHRLADGSIKDVEVFASSIYVNERMVMHSIIHDITLRKKVEEEANKLSLAIEQSPVSVVITDLKGNIEYVNPKFTQVTGYSKEEAIGQNPRILKSGNIPPAVYAGLWNDILSGKEWKGELENRRKNGETFWEMASIAAVKDVDGEILHFIAVKEDITARRAMEIELRRSQQAAEAASKAKSDFLANMSHEIRTPMNAIIGFSDLLQGTELNEKQHRFLDTVKSSGQLLLSLINDILDISKIEAGKIELEVIEFDIEHLVNGMVQLVKPKILEKTIELRVSFEPGLTRWYKGDPTRIRQVVLNMLSNAVKFTDKGEVLVTVSASRVFASGKDRQKIDISVKDTGIGIPEDRRDFLFKAFSQADNSITRRFGGTGLGLAISKAIAQKMKGDITVESKEGQGSEFVFTLELEKGSRHPHEGIGMVSAEEFRGLSVVVVDDNEHSRQIITSHCIKAGITVANMFTGGSEFLQWLEAAREAPAIVIVDMMMPGMSGSEMLANIKAAGKAGRMKFLLVTSDAHAGGAKEAELAGFDAYLAKPVINADLVNVIKTMLGDCRETKAIVTRHMAAEVSLEGMRVLVAEDVEANWLLLQIHLEAFGCLSERVDNGEVAVEKVLTNKYDVCLMDMQMPRMGGLEATQIIRTRIGSNLPVIALTAAVMKEDRDRAFAAGMNDFLVKPINITNLRNILFKWGKRGV